jgi:two-component system phosphate regulon sensor histidine kinase PhoR
MRSLIQRMARFWAAEEIPRWFGMSLVVVYLVGLGMVGFLGIQEASHQSVRLYHESAASAVRILSRALSAPLYFDTAPSARGVCQRTLREFAAVWRGSEARVIEEGGRVVASTEAAEIGTTSPVYREAAEVVGTQQVTDEPARPPRPARRVFRLVVPRLSAGSGWVEDQSDSAAPDAVPVPGEVAPGAVTEARGSVLEGSETPEAAASADPGQGADPGGGSSVNAPGAAARRYVLEIALPLSPAPLRGGSDGARALVAVLVALGVLFVLLRALRRTMHSAARIAERLGEAKEWLADDLGALRIADAQDGVGAAWNTLVQLAADLQTEVRRARACGELNRVMQQGHGGALSQALHALPDAIMYIVAEGRFEYLNASAVRLLGLREGDGKGSSLNDAQPSGVGTEVVSTMRSALRADGNFEVLSRVIELPDGVSAYRMWVTPLPGPKRQGECIVVVRDVSQQIRAERSSEEFVTQVTHELRTPLTNIRAYAETLSSGVVDDPNVVTECYNVIMKETRRLSRLIDDMLSVSQIEVGSIQLEVDTVDLRDLLTDGVRDVRGLAEEKGIDLQLVLPAKMEPINADRDKLAIVVNNLMGNAIKYTPQGGSVLVGCQVKSTEVAITIKDNGIGIAAADHARVFEKFQRADDPEVRAETGSGIGLYTARAITKSHGGDIDLISNPGEGSTFIVRLPHAQGRGAMLSMAQEV